MTRPIFLLTDFGQIDPYVGQVRAVLARLAPGSAVHDLTHDVEPLAVDHGAWLLEVIRSQLPETSVVLGVVDPGVGGSRTAIAIRDEAGRLYVGPDNGLFSCVLTDNERERSPADLDETAAQARTFGPVALGIDPEFVSPTFHGRDVFAPAAAQLAAGRPFDSLGTPIGRLTCVPAHAGRPAGDQALLGRVVHIDRFGNLILTVRSAQLAGRTVERIEVGGTSVGVTFETFEAAGHGRLFWHRDSSGFLAVALAGGNAAAALRANRGSNVRVVFA